MSRLRSLTSSRWFKLGLSVALLALLFSETDLGDVRRVLWAARPAWVLIGFAGYLVSQAMSALRWCMLARPLGFRQPFSRFFVYYFSGMYLNLFAPSTVAGDIGRALFLAGGKRRTRALVSVVADRGLGFVALVWVGAVSIIFLSQYPVPAPLYWGAWLIPPAMVFGWLWGPLLAVHFLPAGHVWRMFVERDLVPYWHDRRLLALSFGLATLFHLVQIWTQIVLAWALDLHIPWSFFLVFVPIVNLAGMLPISLSGIGVREGGYWYFLSLVGIDREAALALGLLSSAVVLASGLTGAPIFLLAPERPHGAAEPASGQPRAAPARPDERGISS